MLCLTPVCLTSLLVSGTRVRKQTLSINGKRVLRSQRLELELGWLFPCTVQSKPSLLGLCLSCNELSRVINTVSQPWKEDIKICICKTARIHHVFTHLAFQPLLYCEIKAFAVWFISATKNSFWVFLNFFWHNKIIHQPSGDGWQSVL